MSELPAPAALSDDMPAMLPAAPPSGSIQRTGLTVPAVGVTKTSAPVPDAPVIEIRETVQIRELPASGAYGRPMPSGPPVIQIKDVSGSTTHDLPDPAK